MPPKTPHPEDIDLKAVLETEGRHGHTLRIDISIGFRTVIGEGSVDIGSIWTASLWDVQPKEWVPMASNPGRKRYAAAKPVFLGTIVSDEEGGPQKLLETLGAIYGAGKLHIQQVPDPAIGAASG